MKQSGSEKNHHERKCDKKMFSLFIKRKARNKSIRSEKASIGIVDSVKKK